MFAWVPYVGAAIGVYSAVGLPVRWMEDGWSANKARKVGNYNRWYNHASLTIISAIASTPLIAVLVNCMILFGFQVSIGNIQTLPSDFYSGKSVGSLAGLGGTTAAIGVVITTYLVPALTVSSYVPFFLLGALLVPFGITSVFIFGGEIKKVTLKAKD